MPARRSRRTRPRARGAPSAARRPRSSSPCSWAWSRGASPPCSHRRPRPPTRPPAEFSAGRAFAHVQQIAAQTHVAGSAADGRSSAGSSRPSPASASTRGCRTRSAPGSPGRHDRHGPRAQRRRRPAGSDSDRPAVPDGPPRLRAERSGRHRTTAPGSSTLLETVRALTAGPQLRNDVVVVLTDAEEACLCGAEAFAASHPLAGSGGVALNFEARGTTGPPIMFETSRGNADLPRRSPRRRRTRWRPASPSRSTGRCRTTPTSACCSPTATSPDEHRVHRRRRGVPHPAGRPERHGPAQPAGDGRQRAGPRARARRPRPAAAGEAGAEDATYFPVLDRLVRYPGSLVWPLAGAALLARAVLALVAARRGISSLRRTAAATALAAAAAGRWAPLAAQGLWSLLVLIRPGYGAMLDPWRPGWYRLAAVARRRRGRAALVRAAAPPDRAARSASAALVWLAVLGGRARRVRARWLVPGGVARAGRGRHRHRRGADRPGWCAAARRWSAARSPSWCSPRPCPCSSRRSASDGRRAAASSRRCCGRPAARLRVALPADPATRRRGRLADRRRPGLGLVLAVACAVVGLIGRQVRRRAPGAQPARLRARPDTGQAWWASTESAPGRVHRRGTSTAADRCRSTSRTWPARTWHRRAQAADLPAPR